MILNDPQVNQRDKLQDEHGHLQLLMEALLNNQQVVEDSKNVISRQGELIQQQGVIIGRLEETIVQQGDTIGRLEERVFH